MSSSDALGRAAIISTGDELTTGQVVDTNAAYLAESLFEVGIRVVAALVVGDDRETMAWAWRQAMELAELVIATGGLGPTADDLTTEVVAQVLGVDAPLDASAAQHIEKIFAAAGRPMPRNNLKQARFPRGATIIPNPLGTAPGYRIEHRPRDGATRHLVALPGVPREMRAMVEQTVLPWLREQRKGSPVHLTRTFQTFGLSESALDERLAGVVDPAEARLSFRASFPEISVRVVVRGEAAEAGRVLESVSRRVRERIGPYLLGEGRVKMEEVVGELLRGRRLTLAVAESCTGGLVGHRITEVPGSSEYLRGGVVAYANEAKVLLLGVDPCTLEREGAVSEAVAREMATGIREALRADLGLAITGIAGPSGGSAEKPVGTVCIALATEQGKVAARRYQLWGTREWIKLLSSQLALDWVRRHCLGLDPAGGVPGPPRCGTER